MQINFNFIHGKFAFYVNLLICPDVQWEMWKLFWYEGIKRRQTVHRDLEHFIIQSM